MKKSNGFSRRSQASWQEQWRLEEELYKNEAWLQIAQANVEKLTKAVEDVKRHMVTTGNVQPSYLGDLTRDLENEKLRLSIHKEHGEKLRKQIKELELPSREQAAARLKQQRLLACLSKERLEADRLIGSVITQLRELLEQRTELSARMRAAADTIGLKTDLDEGRFNALLAALPEDTAAASERWHRCFTGTEQGKKPYVVNAAKLELEENLVSCGVYKSGDSIELSDEQASKLRQASLVEYAHP